MIGLLATLMLILGLFPAALYVLGRMKDPLHPLIFVGAASYFISAHQLLLSPDLALNYLPGAAYVRYLQVALISLGGFYLGWLVSRHRDLRHIPERRAMALPRPGFLFAVGSVCAILGVVLFIAFAGDFTTTGYLRDLEMLWITAAILLVQVIALPEGKKLRVFAILMLLVAIIPPVSRFFSYGQRGDTLRLALIASLFYLVWRKRPFKATFLIAAVAMALVLATLAETRVIVIEDPSQNRVTALAQVIPHFIHEDIQNYKGSEEFIFGAGLDEAAVETGEYGYGKAFTLRMVSRFAPKEFFPDKWDWFNSSVEHEFALVNGLMGYNVPLGAAISGAAEGFFELGWFCPILWFVLGFIHQKLWFRAVTLARIQYSGYLIAFNVAIVYGILQDFYVAEVNMVYVLLPLFLVYHFPSGQSRIARETVALSGAPPVSLA